MLDAEKDPARAIRLLGAGNAVRNEFNVPPTPMEKLVLNRFIEWVRPMLSGENFTTAWAEGQQMSREAAVAYALQAANA